VKKVILEKYPNHCRSCNGRGGVVVPWYSGCTKFRVCSECVGKGSDPLDPSLKLIPPKESLEDEPESWVSPTLNRELNSSWGDSWADTPMGQVVGLQDMIKNLNSLRKDFDILIGK
jgi:hypothetical protein